MRNHLFAAGVATLGDCRLAAAVMIVLALVVLGAPTSAYGQADSCGDAIENAQAQYQDGNFDEAIRLLYECLIRDEVGDEDVVAGHRLLALSYLRKDDLGNARRTIVRLLDRAPGYTPDPIQNPPSYVSLVQNVREQLQVERRSPAPPAEEPIVAEEPEPSRGFLQTMLLEGGMGLTHYGGERGIRGDNPIDELTDGIGFVLELKAATPVSSRIEVGARYSAASYPELTMNKSSAKFVPIDDANSSNWVHAIGVFGTARFFRESPVVPYGRLGITSVYTQKNDVLRAGFGPRIGFGVAVPVTSQVDIFAEGAGSFIFPSDALDLVDEGRDSIYVFAAGVRYRLQGL